MLYCELLRCSDSSRIKTATFKDFWRKCFELWLLWFLLFWCIDISLGANRSEEIFNISGSWALFLFFFASGSHCQQQQYHQRLYQYNSSNKMPVPIPAISLLDVSLSSIFQCFSDSYLVLDPELFLFSWRAHTGSTNIVVGIPD